MILFHDILDLVEVFLGEIVAVLEDASDFMIDVIEGVEVLFLEMPLFGLVGEEGDLIGDLLVILH